MHKFYRIKFKLEYYYILILLASVIYTSRKKVMLFTINSRKYFVMSFKYYFFAKENVLL